MNNILFANIGNFNNCLIYTWEKTIQKKIPTNFLVGISTLFHLTVQLRNYSLCCWFVVFVKFLAIRNPRSSILNDIG